jgi:gluconokinase
MGPSGCGKSTLGARLAGALGWRFVEGDTLHPPANLARMAAGMPLDDADRAPFLDNVVAAILESSPPVVTCSALKRRYRDRLRDGCGPLLFVLPEVTAEVLRARVAGRTGHFMPASLVDSQLATFEPPQADEDDVVVVDGAADPAVAAAEVMRRIAARAS